MIQPIRTLFALFVILLLSVACGGGNGSGDTGNQSSGSTQAGSAPQSQMVTLSTADKELSI